MIAVSVITDNDFDSQKLGLLKRHSYGVLGAITVTQENGKKVRIINLRNPWGSHEWNGDWSDNSEKWTPELRKQAGITKY